MYTYLLFIVVVSFPALAYAVIHRRFLKREYKYTLFPVYIWLLAAVLFSVEVVAMQAGWWQVFPSKTFGINVLGVPLEEFVFFLFIPQITLLVWALSRQPGSAKRAWHYTGHHPRQFMKWWRSR